MESICSSGLKEKLTQDTWKRSIQNGNSGCCNEKSNCIQEVKKCSEEERLRVKGLLGQVDE